MALSLSNNDISATEFTPNWSFFYNFILGGVNSSFELGIFRTMVVTAGGRLCYDLDGCHGPTPWTVRDDQKVKVLGIPLMAFDGIQPICNFWIFDALQPHTNVLSHASPSSVFYLSDPAYPRPWEPLFSLIFRPVMCLMPKLRGLSSSTIKQ